MHDVIHIPLVIFSIWDFYFDVSEWHILPARTGTPALMLYLTNPCAKRKVCSLTKPKGINFYLLRTFCPHLGSFFVCCFFFHYVSAKFHLWPSSGDLLRPRIGMMSLVTVSPVITAFHSCCLSHHVFDQVNIWPAWVGFETANFWQCSPGTVETQHLYPLNHGPWSPQ